MLGNYKQTDRQWAIPDTCKIKAIPKDTRTQKTTKNPTCKTSVVAY